MMELPIPDIHPDREIVSSRIVHTAKEIVFRAWSEPDHLAAWWGPAGFTNSFEIFDFHPGGRWKFIMHGPDKGNYPNEVEFLKIEEPSLIWWNRISQPHFQVLVTFKEIAENQTEIMFRMIFASREECDKLKKFVVEKNEENFDRLEKELLNIS